MRRPVQVALLGAALSCANASEDVQGGAVGTPGGAGSGASDDRGAPAAASRTRVGSKTILFVGTSLTAGLGLDPELAYPAVIQSKIDSAGLPYVVRNAGLSGETSAGALRRIDWLLRDTAHVVVIETGANDGLRGVNPDSTRENIQGIIDIVRGRFPEARIVLAGMEAPPNFGVEYTARFRSLFPELARRNGALLIPFLLEGVALVPTMNQNDGIHPNAAGARRVAENVWGVLRGALRE